MNENLLNIEIIKEYIAKKKIDWTKHCLNRLNQRDILISDVKTAVNNGKIIEYYYDDYPYPSCLTLGNTNTNKPLHTVVGTNGNQLWIVTAYYPAPEKWMPDLKTRREE